MTILPILYWLVLLISIIFSTPLGNRVPGGVGTWNFGGLVAVALFVIIGLKIFRIPLQ
jgi:hypothetical protein